jgi:hypothetical protein
MPFGVIKIFDFFVCGKCQGSRGSVRKHSQMIQRGGQMGLLSSLYRAFGDCFSWVCVDSVFRQLLHWYLPENETQKVAMPKIEVNVLIEKSCCLF